MERRAFSVSFTHNNSFKLSKSESATHVCKFHDRYMVPALPLLVSLALPLWVLSRLLPSWYIDVTTAFTRNRVPVRNLFSALGNIAQQQIPRYVPVDILKAIPLYAPDLISVEFENWSDRPVTAGTSGTFIHLAVVCMRLYLSACLCLCLCAWMLVCHCMSF